MPDPKTLLLKLTDATQTANIITVIGGIPDDLSAADFEAKTQTAANSKGQAGTTPPIPESRKQG
jgi:hypothetical protein